MAGEARGGACAWAGLWRREGKELLAWRMGIVTPGS